MAAIERATGQRLGRPQVEALATRAAVHFDAFYARARDFTFSRVSGFDAQTRRLTTSGFSASTYPDS